MGSLKENNMENNKKDKIVEIEQFEINNKNVDFQSENQEDPILNKMKQNLGIKRILKPNESFAYDGHKCLTHCDGYCCSNIEIPLSPYDIFKIVTSPVGRKLGLIDTTKLFMKNPPITTIYLGDQSGLPQASLDFRSNGRYRKICPFAQIVSTNNFRFKLECGIHEIKPLACRISPLGRTKAVNSDNSFYYIHKPVNDCSCVNSNKRIRILDYIRENRLHEYFANRDKISEIYPLLIGTPSEFRFIAGFLMFNFDLIFISQGLEASVVRPRNFNTLIRKITSVIIEYKKLI